MNFKPLRDQRGVAMVFELALVVAVLSLVGFAIFQSNKYRGGNDAASVQTNSKVSADVEAESTVKAVEQDIATEAAVSAESEAAADAEMTAAEADMVALGGSFDEADF